MFDIGFHMTHCLHLCSGDYSMVQVPKPVYLEFCKLWSSLEFKAKSENKKLNHGNDLKHRYGADGHIHRGQCMVRLYVQVLYTFLFYATNS
jgi:hypothetical protein